jgi:hypothetical protein
MSDKLRGWPPMSLILSAAALLLLSPARAAEAGRVEIVSVSGYAPALATRMITPFERLLRHTPGVELVDIDNVAASYAGSKLRYNMADMPQTELERLAAGRTAATEAIETVDGFSGPRSLP